jgi:hypothetical protein
MTKRRPVKRRHKKVVKEKMHGAEKHLIRKMKKNK